MEGRKKLLRTMCAVGLPCRTPGMLNDHQEGSPQQGLSALPLVPTAVGDAAHWAKDAVADTTPVPGPASLGVKGCSRDLTHSLKTQVRPSEPDGFKMSENNVPAHPAIQN